MNNEHKKGLVPELRFPEFQNAGTWNNSVLGDISTITSGGTPNRTKQEYWNGNIPWITTSLVDFNVIQSANEFISELGLKESSAKIFPKNTILMAMYGQGITRGKVAILGIDAATNQACAAILLKKEINTSFAFQNLASRYDEIRDLSNQGGQENLSGGLIEKIPFSFPTSDDEQTKIAACLSSLDDLITAQTQKIEALKTHKKGLMQQLFPQEGETVPMLRFPEFSGDWVETTLIKIAKFRRGSFPQPYGLPEWYDNTDGMPFIQVFDVGDDLRLKPKTKNKISELAAKQSVFIPKGTVIITIQGSIGRVAITQYDAYIDRTLLLFEKFLKPMEKLFFAYVLQILFEIEKEKAPGGIIKTITKEVLSEFKIRYPSEEEQQKIADCLSSLDDLINAHVKKCELLKTHKKGLMQGLFPSSNEAV